MEEVRNQVQEIFREVFDHPALLLNDQMTAEDVEGWDSLQHINLMIAIEKRLGVKFATAEISRLKGDDSNVGSLVELVVRKKNLPR
jgi:acyl carrier protein